MSIKTDIGFLLIVILPKMIIVKLVDSFSRAFRGTGAFALVSAQDKQSFVTTRQKETVGLATPSLVAWQVTHTHVSNEEEHRYYEQQYQHTHSDEWQLEPTSLDIQEIMVVKVWPLA